MNKLIDFDFDTSVNRKGTWCTQWDYVGDRFGVDDLLPFTISDMDFKTAPCIQTALQKRIANDVLGYSRWQHTDYLNAIIDWFKGCFNATIDPAQIVYGPSVIYIIAKLIHLWSLPDDEIILHAPAYDAFYNVIVSNNRKVNPLPLYKQKNTWFCDMDELEQELAKPKAKILLLCNPHNPTGKVWQENELKQIADLCAKHDIKVISDEIHMDMVWQRNHLPWVKVASSEWAIISSASKSFNVPALLGAYGIISDNKTRKHYLDQLKLNDGLSSPALFSMIATIAAYREGIDWLTSLKQYLWSNLCYVSTTLNASFNSLALSPPEGTYFNWIDLTPLKIDNNKLQNELIHRHRVAIMNGSIYGRDSENFLRLNVGCPRSKLEMGVNAIMEALKKLA